MVAKCKRGKFRLVRVENVFITRPDLTTTPPPPSLSPTLLLWSRLLLRFVLLTERFEKDWLPDISLHSRTA